MKRDAFSQYHPLVNFIFFVFAIGLGVVIRHPAYLLAAGFASGLYLIQLQGRKAVKTFLILLPVFAGIALINPIFNTQGQTVLFSLFGRPYTLEALYFGCAVGGIFLIMMFWFGCYNAVLTTDKFCALFGAVIPSLSLLLVMTLRLLPNLLRKLQQIAACRSSIGKGVNARQTNRQKLAAGMEVLSALTTWALEGSMITADSMRCRGYGSGKRSSFRTYRFTLRDGLLLGIALVLAAIVLWTAFAGGTQAEYTPALLFAPLRGRYLFGFIAYCVFLLIPTILHGKEALLWRICISKI